MMKRTAGILIALSIAMTGPVFAHSAIEKTKILRIVITEQHDRLIQEMASRFTAHAPERKADHIELNAINRLNSHIWVYNDEVFMFGGLDKERQQYEKLFVCFEAAEQLNTYAKTVVRILRKDLPEFTDDTEIKKYRTLLADCDAAIVAAQLGQ